MEVEVFSCNDGLEAKLVIKEFKGSQWKKDFGEAGSFYKHILKQGLEEKSLCIPEIDSLHRMLSESAAAPAPQPAILQEAQSVSIASGEMPQHEEIDGLLFHKSYFTKPEDIHSLRDGVKREDMDAFKKTLDPNYLVEIGQIILSFRFIKEGRPGKDVYGKPIPFKPYSDLLPSAASSISKLEKKWVALKSGVLILEDNKLKILGSDDVVSQILQVSADQMKVSLVLKDGAGIDDGPRPTLSLVKGALTQRGILGSFEEDAVSTALDAYFDDGVEQEIILVQGVPAQDGEAGRMETLVDLEPTLPDPDAIGKIDFKTFTFFKTIRKGERIARNIPPAPGAPGYDVFGNPILPETRLYPEVKLGKNTEPDPGNPEFVIASCAGKIALSDGVPHVVDTLQVSKDISLKTGNISFPGSIDVQGDVRDNLAIEAKGDIDISGVVEDGIVTSDGAIIVKGGFTGTGKGVIKSKSSSVTIGYIRNQRIESHSNIIVYNEVMNATLMARKSIQMKSGSHSVVGGSLTAYSSIEIFNAGNESGMKTFLEVGRDFEVAAEIKAKRALLEEIRVDFDFLEKSLSRLASLIKWEGGMNPENRLLAQRVKGVMQSLAERMTSLKGELNDLESRLFNTADCYIAIRGTAFPGTVLRYKDKTIMISEKAHNRRWLFQGGASARRPEDKHGQ